MTQLIYISSYLQMIYIYFIIMIINNARPFFASSRTPTTGGNCSFITGTQHSFQIYKNKKYVCKSRYTSEEELYMHISIR